MGQQALSYVRLRHELSENGDIGRMKRQQAFLASMANKAISAGTLVNPVRLYNFLDAATNSLTTDPGLASLKKLGGLAKQLKDIGLDKIQFLSIPFEAYEPDPNRLALAPDAENIWTKLREDEPLNRRQSLGITTAAQDPDGDKPGRPGAEPSPSEDASQPPSRRDEAEAAARAQSAAENGLCA
jgi:anionic cell wall polymer biosynthesis LytR-Cps2A-Psr (LCP) family protein